MLSSNANWDVGEPSHSPSPPALLREKQWILAPRQPQASLRAPARSLPQTLRLSPALPPLPAPPGFKQLNSAAQNGAGGEGQHRERRALLCYIFEKLARPVGNDAPSNAAAPAQPQNLYVNLCCDLLMELLRLDFYFTSFQLRNNLFQSPRQELGCL